MPIDLPGNQLNKKKERPKQEKIITGNVVQRPPSLWQRATSSLISADQGESVWSFVVMDVLIPAAKNMVSDAVSQGVERLLFGDLRVRSRADRPSGYVSYNRIGGARRAAPDFNRISQRGRAQHNFEDVILPTRGEAMDVLDRLNELVTQYGQATVADFYDLVGITSQFTDNEWGWIDLSRADIRHVRGGYQIVLPRTQPIE